MEYNNKLKPIKKPEPPKEKEVDISDWLTWEGKEEKPENKKPTITPAKSPKK